MNIFMLDHDPRVCAEYHIDRHVVKMLTEYAQLMSSAHRFYGSDDPELYRETHKNHPSTMWVREGTENYEWLYSLWINLHDEYQFRYGDHKVHAAFDRLEVILDGPPRHMPFGSTPLRLAMPDEFKSDCPVQSYRSYYETKRNDKNGKFQYIWTNRGMPDWAYTGP